MGLRGKHSESLLKLSFLGPPPDSCGSRCGLKGFLGSTDAVGPGATLLRTPSGKPSHWEKYLLYSG